jgi:hypothetical protein
VTQIGEGVSVAVDSSGSDSEPPPGKLKVKLLEECTGDAIEGAEVTARIDGKEKKVKSDSSGIADFGEVSPSSYFVKIKKHYADADYFLILIHYPRFTWKRKAIVEEGESATVPEGGEEQIDVELKVYRVVAPIVFKRKQIDPFGEDKYGHWWTELGGGESYGWWPSQGVGVIDTIRGVPGALNGVPHFPSGTPTRDPHDGDPGDQQFSPVIDDCRSDEELKDKIRTMARGYSGNWSWFFELGNHCHTFQKKAIKVISARGFKDV